MKYQNKSVILLGIIHLTFLAHTAESSIFVTDVKMNKMIELNARKPHCRLHTDRGDIQSTVLKTDPLKIRQVPEETISTLENVCFEGNQLSGEIQGTLWCGPGSIAKNYSELGRHVEEDKCCRAHDNCYPQIAPGECLKSICNHGAFTRLHCDCDEKFRRCLSDLNTETANTLGAAFFNAIQVTCFDFRRPCTNLQRNDCELAYFPVRRFAFYDDDLDPLENMIVAEARTSNGPARPVWVGFNEAEQEEICSRYKFRPAPKFKARIITYKTYT